MSDFSQLGTQTDTSVPAQQAQLSLGIAGLHFLLLAAALVFFVLHYLHLSADFPNFSRWMDWSKYTDEGWYGDAAIRFYQLGHWNLPGDFNPAAALPMWPLLEALIFRFTGVSLVAERALTVSVFGGVLVAGWFLIARRTPDAGLLSEASLPASAAILLLAANPFCFVFTRMGILEPLLILNTVVALLVARQARAVYPDPLLFELLRRNVLVILALGLLMPVIVLTKTTGLFLLPAVIWMLFASLDYRPRPFLAIALPAGLLAIALWFAYFFILVRPHYLLDYRYLFSANANTGITRDNWWSAIVWSIHGIAWMGRSVAVASCAAVAFALLRPRRFFAHPIIPVLVLWAGGYTAFLAYHNNLQPRYYLVIAVPLTLLLPVVIADLLLPHLRRPVLQRIGALATALLATIILLADARETLQFVRHPEYTYITAARQIAALVAQEHRADPTHSTLILSISGSDLSLMTGLHSICDDFGTAELADRARQYNPGWDVSWNLIEDDKMDDLTPAFHVKRVAAFAALDDQDRNQLILYRLDPTDTGEPVHRARTRRRTKVGQQPSPVQLGH